MWLDQWLVKQIAKAFRWRYSRVLQAETAKWQESAERGRLQLQVNQLGTCGKDVTIRPGAQFIAPQNIHLGDHIGIGSFAILRGNGGISLGNYVLLGDQVILATASHPIDGLYFHHNWEAPIHLEDNVWVGANALVMPGVTIGENSVIGAGAVVTEDIPPNSVAVGVPAQITKTLAPDTDRLQAQKEETRHSRLQKIQRHTFTPDVFEKQK